MTHQWKDISVDTMKGLADRWRYIEIKAELALAEIAIKSNLTLHLQRVEGYLPKDKDETIITKSLPRKLGLKLIEQYYKANRLVYTSGETLIALELPPQTKIHQRKIRIDITTLSKAAVLALEDFAKVNFVDHSEKRKLHVLVEGKYGLSIESAGVISSTLREANYPKEIIESYLHISEELKSNTPCGRLSILSGPPGTGKTYLLKALITDNPRATFIHIPNSLITSLDGSTLLKTFLDFIEEEDNEEEPDFEVQSGDGPLVLLMEDADMALAPRAADNMSSIQTLLNLADGMLGELLNVRIIATTNAKHQDFEEALLRHGRLCCHSKFRALTKEEANACYKTITEKHKEKEDEPFAEQKILADIYAYIKTKGNLLRNEKEARTRRIGFGSESLV